MSGDPRVLAPLQQAFNAADNAHVRQAIIYAWEFETDTRSTVQPRIDDRIRAWTPPPAEPSLEQRVTELERFKSDLMDDLFKTNQRLLSIERQHPEPTAPDDPVCATCGHKSELHGVVGGCFPHGGCDCERFVEPTAPAPDLDPVRVAATSSGH